MKISLGPLSLSKGQGRDEAPRTAWVVGASSGIGEQVVRLLAERGWQVVASARRAERLASLPAVSAPCDVTDEQSVRDAWTQVVRAVGVPGLVVYAAGRWQQTDIEEWSSAQLNEHVDTNLLGLGRVLDVALEPLRQRGSGRLAVVASVAGFRGVPGAEYYGPTKAALINLCEALRGSLSRWGIAVTTICPGFVDTEMTQVNDFPMPFIVTAERAAREVVDGIERGDDLVVFPRRMAATMQTARLLPPSLWSRVTRRTSQAG